MEVLGWIWWLLASLAGLVASLVWFLIGGWVSTLAQIGVIVLLIFGYKYGWRQAPREIVSRTARVSRAGWGWVRSREVGAALPARNARERIVRARPQRASGAINLSTLLNILMLAGLAAAALV